MVMTMLTRSSDLAFKNWALYHKLIHKQTSRGLSVNCSEIGKDFTHSFNVNVRKESNTSHNEQNLCSYKPSSMIGMGRVFISGSGIGSDTSMVSSNHRWNRKSMFSTNIIVNKSPTNATFGARNFSAAATADTAKEDDSMDDEYGEMTADGNTYLHHTPYQLENGEVLAEAGLRYQTYGTLNEERDNVIVVCHALTGNASLRSWWGELLGPGLAFDTSKYFVVCANILGSCYGSTSPTSINPVDPEQKPYLNSFPNISVRDSVRLQLLMLQNDLNVRSIKSVIGGSFGGMQVLEYAMMAGSENAEFVTKTSKATKPFIRSFIPIACGAVHTAWQIAISETQRQAIYADPKWNDGNVDLDDPPEAGLSVARQIGMVSYRTAIGYEQKFGRSTKGDASPKYGSKADWQVKSYLKYQGIKFLDRFDPITYVKLTEQMDSHDVGRDRGGKEKALSTVTVPSVVLGIDSDILYPLSEQIELVDLLPGSDLKVVRSDAGHDGFLLEQDQVDRKSVV